MVIYGSGDFVSNFIVTVTEQVADVTVTEQVIEISDATAGPQGPKGDTGATGATGATGPSGVIAVDSGELTNTGTSTSAQLGLATAGTAGTYTKVTTDQFGRVSSGTTLGASDLPNHASRHASGGADPVTISDSQLASGVTTSGEPNKIIKVGSSGITTVSSLYASNIYFPDGGLYPPASSGQFASALPSSDGGTLISTADSGTVSAGMLDPVIAQNVVSGMQSGYGAQIQPFSAFSAVSNNITLVSGTVNICAFTAPYTGTVSQVTLHNNTAVATVTNFRIGLYSWSKNGSNSRWTLLASYDPTSPDTTALATGSTFITKTLTAYVSGGLNLTAGVRYGIGVVSQFSSGTPAIGAAASAPAQWGDPSKIDYPLFGYKNSVNALVDSGVGYIDQTVYTAARNAIWFKLS